MKLLIKTFVIKRLKSQQARTYAVHLGRNLFQQEVDGPVDIPVAIVKSHHALILISACDLNELKDTHKRQLEKEFVLYMTGFIKSNLAVVVTCLTLPSKSASFLSMI